MILTNEGATANSLTVPFRIQKCLLKTLIISGFKISKQKAWVYKKQLSSCYLVSALLLIFTATICRTKKCASLKSQWNTENGVERSKWKGKQGNFPSYEEIQKNLSILLSAERSACNFSFIYSFIQKRSLNFAGSTESNTSVRQIRIMKEMDKEVHDVKDMLLYIKLRALNKIGHSVKRGRDSSASIATRYGRDGPEIESLWGRDFPQSSRGPPSLLHKG